MAQFFHSSSNFIARLSLVLGVLGAGGGLALLLITSRSPYNTAQGKPINQPVPFSHKHHVKGLGIDCRHCHFSVEESGFAGIPPTKTCMTCHSQIWSEAPMLEPVRESYRTDESIDWVRVHDLPDYVYFSHKRHVRGGVQCTECHGQVQLQGAKETVFENGEEVEKQRRCGKKYLTWFIRSMRNSGSSTPT